MRRFRSLEAKVDDKGVMRLTASTNAAVRFGSWREILVHTETAIDRTGAQSLLINHDPNQIAGSIDGMTVVDGELRAHVNVLADARLASGVTVRDAVNAGALRGVSIGYDYAQEDAEWDDQNRTVTVKRWRLMEITLTPIPADVGAGVRACPFQESNTRADRHITDKDLSMNFELWLKARGFDLSKLTAAELTKMRAIHAAEGEPSADFAPHARIAAPGDESARAAEIANVRARADKAERELKLRAMAETHGVDVKGLDFGTIASEAEGLAELLKRKARKEETNLQNPAVVVTKDQGDKLLAHCRASLVSTARVTPDEDDKAAIKLAGGMRTMPMRQMLRALARAEGHLDADYWSEIELAQWGQNLLDFRTFRTEHRRDGSAANKISSGFSTLLANVANKALQAGLSDYNASTWQIWCTQRNVANFLQITNTNLASGILTETAENEAFPELTQKDGGYNSTLGLFGATVSLTWQMLVNDMLGRFMAELRRTGAIAALTVDKLAYSKLLNATWTNDVSASSPLSTPANLDKPRAALKNKLSPAGQKMGTIARYLLHDTVNAVAAQVATGAIYGPGQTTAPSQGSAKIQTIESHWIGDTALYASALTTDYYVAADPNLADTVLVNFLEGVGFSPIIMPYDAGAVAAEKWKIMLPVQATIASYANSAATTQFGGLQKAQA